MKKQNFRCSTNEKIMYDRYSLLQPDFVNGIEMLVQKGHSPTDIENFMRMVVADSSQLANHAYGVANYILRQQISQN